MCGGDGTIVDQRVGGDSVSRNHGLTCEARIKLEKVRRDGRARKF